MSLAQRSDLKLMKEELSLQDISWYMTILIALTNANKSQKFLLDVIQYGILMRLRW